MEGEHHDFAGGARHGHGPGSSQDRPHVTGAPPAELRRTCQRRVTVGGLQCQDLADLAVQGGHPTAAAPVRNAAATSPRARNCFSQPAAAVTAQGHPSRTRHARSGDFYLASNGDSDLAASGNFFMATDMEETLRPPSPALRAYLLASRVYAAAALTSDRPPYQADRLSALARTAASSAAEPAPAD